MGTSVSLSRKAFAELTSQGLEGAEMKNTIWEVHKNHFTIGRGFAMLDCFWNLSCNAYSFLTSLLS